MTPIRLIWYHFDTRGNLQSPKREKSLTMKDQRTLFDLTQDGLIIGTKIQRIYPEFDVSAFVSDARTETDGLQQKHDLALIYHREMGHKDDH